jgi:phage gpG-like protein
MRVLSATKDRAVIGFGSMTEAKKAWWAQDGTKTRKGKVKSPKRPFFGLSPRDGASLRAFADDYIHKLVKTAEAQR